MKYAMCPTCGRRLCKGEPGTKVEIECPKCGEFAIVTIQSDDLIIKRRKSKSLYKSSIMKTE